MSDANLIGEEAVLEEINLIDDPEIKEGVYSLGRIVETEVVIDRKSNEIIIGNLTIDLDSYFRGSVIAIAKVKLQNDEYPNRQIQLHSRDDLLSLIMDIKENPAIVQDVGVFIPQYFDYDIEEGELFTTP